MSKTILVGDDPVQMELYALNLKAYVGTEVTVLDNANKAMKFIELDSSIDIIITCDVVKKENTAQILSKFLKKNELNITFCVIGKGDKSFEYDHIFPYNVDLKELIKAVARILDVTAQDMVKQAVGDYYPIPINFFDRMEAMVCDVFLRLNKADGGYQYVCKFKSGKTMEAKLIEEYQKKGITNLYVPALSRLKFTNAVSATTISLLKSSSITPDERVKAVSKGMQIISEEIESVGLTENTVELANNCVNSLQKTVHEYPKLYNLLRRLLDSPESWLYKYCQILTFVTSTLR